MSKENKPRITLEQGQLLLRLSANFNLPDKLGEGDTFNVADQGIAAEEVRALYRELKARSPIYLKTRSKLVFGPADGWTKTAVENGEVYEVKDEKMKVELRLDPNSHMGAYWCCLVALHPASSIVSNVGTQEDVLWPLAETLRLTNMLKKGIGIDKAQHKRLELDAPPKDKKEGEKASKN